MQVQVLEDAPGAAHGRRELLVADGADLLGSRPERGPVACREDQPHAGDQPVLALLEDRFAVLELAFPRPERPDLRSFDEVHATTNSSIWCP